MPWYNGESQKGCGYDENKTAGGDRRCRYCASCGGHSGGEAHVQPVPGYLLLPRGAHGGGENGETPIEAAKRETFEEIGVEPKNIQQLTCIAHVPAGVIAESKRQRWDKNTFVIPEYSFAFECDLEPTLSNEHTKYKWVTYDEGRKLLKWDSNKVAMYEIKCILENRE